MPPIVRPSEAPIPPDCSVLNTLPAFPAPATPPRRAQPSPSPPHSSLTMGTPPRLPASHPVPHSATRHTAFQGFSAGDDLAPGDTQRLPTLLLVNTGQMGVLLAPRGVPGRGPHRQRSRPARQGCRGWLRNPAVKLPMAPWCPLGKRPTPQSRMWGSASSSLLGPLRPMPPCPASTSHPERQ